MADAAMTEGCWTLRGDLERVFEVAGLPEVADVVVLDLVEAFEAYLTRALAALPVLEGISAETIRKVIVPRHPPVRRASRVMANGRRVERTSAWILDIVEAHHPTPVARRDLVKLLRPPNFTVAQRDAADNLTAKAIKRLTRNHLLLLAPNGDLRLPRPKPEVKRSSSRASQIAMSA